MLRNQLEITSVASPVVSLALSLCFVYSCGCDIVSMDNHLTSYFQIDKSVTAMYKRLQKNLTSEELLPSLWDKCKVYTSLSSLTYLLAWARNLLMTLQWLLFLNIEKISSCSNASISVPMNSFKERWFCNYRKSFWRSTTASCKWCRGFIRRRTYLQWRTWGLSLLLCRYVCRMVYNFMLR